MINFLQVTQTQRRGENWMKKKAQSIIIAARGQCSSILCDGKLYWSGPITEIEFHHKAGEMASISITANQLPVTPDEDERLKDSFYKSLDGGRPGLWLFSH